jgi:dTMP kinase
MEILQNFIVLEGLDGAGTTSQLRRAESHLKDKGIRAFITNEPTDTSEMGHLVRKVLKGEVKTTDLALAYLFCADREDHVNNPCSGIRKHLADKEAVISDRYLFSSLAYQSIGCSFDKVKALNDFPYPSVLIYIDTPVMTCVSRIETRGAQKEIFEHAQILEKVRANYERSFEGLEKGTHLYRLDGTKSIAELEKEITAILDKEIQL